MTQNTFVRIDPDIHARLKSAALAYKVGMGQVVNDLVRSWLQEHKIKIEDGLIVPDCEVKNVSTIRAGGP